MALVGNELLQVQGLDANGVPAASTQQTTTAAIAALATGGGTTAAIVNTNITTVGNGTLTAAGLVGGLINRSGPVAAYADTTATAAQIVAAIGAFNLNATFFVRIKNGCGFTQTLSAGTGVTLPATNLLAPFQEVWMYGTIGGTSVSPTVVFTHLMTVSIAESSGLTTPLAGALATVGAGTITAALFAGGVVVRGGSQSNAAFTDTTDTGTAIVAQNPALLNKVNASTFFWYQNNTNASATLAGGTGVTVSGITVVQAGGAALYVITQTAANTLTMVGIVQTNTSTTNGTFVANGASAVVVADTRLTANSVVSFGLKTVGGTPAGSPFLSAVTPGTGFSVKAIAGDSSTYNFQIIG